jgi:RNA polymerase sigma factor (sigma-70 family)
MVNRASTQNNEQIMQACMLGDRKSQELLYKIYYSFAMSICLRYANNKEEALEVVNDGFMKVFTKGESYNTNQDFKPWLRKIMVNTAIDNYKKNKKHYYHEDLSKAVEVPTEETNSMSQLSYETLIGFIQMLSPSYQMTFNLYAIEGLPHEQVAQKMGISVGTSKSNLARARINLREMLRKNNYQMIDNE